MTWLLAAAAVLALWAGIAALRRSSEYRRTDAPTDGRTETTVDDDEIDRKMLEDAEREVRDLDVDQRPEDGFEGDDWGPGAAPHRKR